MNSNTAININWRAGTAFEKATTVLPPRIAKFGVKLGLVRTRRKAGVEDVDRAILWSTTRGSCVGESIGERALRRPLSPFF